MIPRLQTLSKLVFYAIMLWTTINAQPKLSFHLGGGFYSPSLGFLDPDSNSVIPSLSSFSKNILLDWGVKYQFYPNARIGYARSNSYHSGKMGDSDFLRTLSYRMIIIETFYYPRQRMELNFMLAPMYNKAIVKLTAKSSSAGWDSLLGSYGNSSVNLFTGEEMTKRWFGLASTIGFRYYIKSWLAVDGRAGFIQNAYSEKKWKLEKEKVDGPKMNIKKLPVFNVHLVLGW
ncbi:MAG: hypothetical protein QF743_08990 [Candidatus Marinimicrobia bacterium]|jgi:hypothetical protein|nr:hypothetical protein [Candidatus Neomarinimicrobiota bacterium]|tara:strand:+ start:11743 stop:12435 length:693 start_codon:yes stop_codon:yes gene_type:complete